MKSLEELYAEKEALRIRGKEIDELINQLLANTTVLCGHEECKHPNRIGDLVYIQTHWYTAPHGCSEGDYWNEGEGQFKCLACGGTNRLFRLPNIQKQRHLFKSIDRVYDR